MRRSTCWCFAAWLAVQALSGPAAGHPTPAETRDELTALCRQLEASDNIYFGTSMIEALERDLAIAKSARRPDIAIRAAGFLGMHLIRLDRLEEAITQLEPARRLADQVMPDEQALRRMLGLTLAAAHLQLAEDQNCVENHSARSCILPVVPSAVHRRPDELRKALAIYRELAERHPSDLRTRWLLNITSMLIGAWPAAVPAPMRLPADALAGDPTWAEAWHDIAPQLGVAAFDLAGGAVVDDFDGDGLLDIVTSSSYLCTPLKAWRNDGRGGFEAVATTWQLDGQLGGHNLTQADVDGDGDLDLLVLRGGWLGAHGRIRNSLLRNDLSSGRGFVDVTAAAGLASPAFPTQTAAFADYDLDGDLDLYIGNETTSSSEDPLSFLKTPGEPYPSQLFRNDGVDAGGTPRFTDVTAAAGVSNEAFTKGVAWGDVDNDGDPDLYVSRLGANRLFRNDGPNAAGEVTFTDIAAAAGVTAPLDLSFACWFFDVDNDGDLDLFVADYASPQQKVFAGYFGLPTVGGHPLLYRNDGAGPGGVVRFTEVSEAWGLRRPLLPMGANFGDLDNDGWLDVYLGTGTPEFDAIMPNVMYRNEAGRGFRDITMGGGFGHLQKGHGIAFGDLDNDGDQDLYEQLGGAFPYDAYGNVLFMNPGSEHAWVTLRLEGKRANRFGVGARIAVTVSRPDGGERTVHALVSSGGSFGASSLQQEIGLGDARRIGSIIVRWPGGTVDRFADLAVDRFYRLVEGEAVAEPLVVPAITFGAGDREPAAAAHGQHRSGPP